MGASWRSVSGTARPLSITSSPRCSRIRRSERTSTRWSSSGAPRRSRTSSIGSSPATRSRRPTFGRSGRRRRSRAGSGIHCSIGSSSSPSAAMNAADTSAPAARHPRGSRQRGHAVRAARPRDAPCIDRDAFMADRIAAERKAGHDVLLLAGIFHVWRPADGEPGVTTRLDAMGIPTYVLLPFGGPLFRDTAVREHLSDAAPGSSRVTGWRPRGRASCAAASRSTATIRRATRPAMSARCRMWPMASSTSAHKCQVPVAEVASVARRALATTPVQKSTAARS